MNTENRLRDIIKTKGSKICLAADVSTLDELYKIIDEVGDYICILKIHYDIISHFNENIESTINKLNSYKKRYNFLIWEDRKFADIGMVMNRQITNHIIKWADIISVHPIAGIDSLRVIPEDIAVILIAELSSTNNLIREPYTLNVIEMCETLNNCIGIVCQRRLNTKKLIFTPGISLSSNSDNMGQKYSKICEKAFADVFVVGRGILSFDDKKSKIYEYIRETNLV